MKLFDPFKFELPGTIRKIVDGDTFHVDVVLDNQYVIPCVVRLIGVDAAEKQTAPGKLLKTCMQKLVGTDVVVRSIKKDPYGRNLGEIFLNEESLSSLLLMKRLVREAGSVRVERTPSMLEEEYEAIQEWSNNGSSFEVRA